MSGSMMEGYKHALRQRLATFQNGGIMPDDPERERFERWWATVHDEVWAIVNEGHEAGETTSLMMMTRRDADGARPHMFVGKNFDDIVTEIVMLDDAVWRVAARAIGRVSKARFIDVHNRSRQARRKVRREAGR